MTQLPVRMFRKITFSQFFNGTPCWVWTAYCNNAGYGMVKFNGKAKLTHRLIYELLVGPIPDGLTLDHLCRNRACCNPAHMEVVTWEENLRRGLRGELNTHCPQSHPYDEKNTAYYKGWRRCRECHRNSSKVRYLRSQGRAQ